MKNMRRLDPGGAPVRAWDHYELGLGLGLELGLELGLGLGLGLGLELGLVLGLGLEKVTSQNLSSYNY